MGILLPQLRALQGTLVSNTLVHVSTVEREGKPDAIGILLVDYPLDKSSRISSKLLVTRAVADVLIEELLRARRELG